jgi:hypothetical protein
LSSAALAFQESKGGGVAEGQQQQVLPQGGSSESPLDLKDTGVSVAPPTGVEVRIPGLGKLGELPKFDFGLELLYGANEPKTQDLRQTGPGVSDDVQIRGSLKHRF